MSNYQKIISNPDFINVAVLTADNEYFSIESKKGFETYWNAGLLEEIDPVPMPNPKYFYNFRLKLNYSDVCMDIEEFLTKLKNGVISIELNGYWDDHDYIKKDIIKKVERKVRDKKNWYNEQYNSLKDSEKVVVDSITTDKQYYNLDRNLISNRCISAIRTKISLLENIFTGVFGEVRFGYDRLYIHGYPTANGSTDSQIPLYFNQTINQIQLGRKMTQNYQEYCKPTTSKIYISTGVIFGNWFVMSDEIDKSFSYEDRQMNTTKQLQRYQNKFAERNIGYGQTSNSSYYVLENDDEYILTTYLFDDWMEFNDVYNDIEAFEKGLTEDFLYMQRLEDYYKVLNNTNNLGDYIYYKPIDMSVWRWECINQEYFLLEDENSGRDFVKSSYNGYLRINNHYRQNTDLPDCIIAVIEKVK